MKMKHEPTIWTDRLHIEWMDGWTIRTRTIFLGQLISGATFFRNIFCTNFFSGQIFVLGATFPGTIFFRDSFPWEIVLSQKKMSHAGEWGFVKSSTIFVHNDQIDIQMCAYWSNISIFTIAYWKSLEWLIRLG